MITFFKNLIKRYNKFKNSHHNLDLVLKLITMTEYKELNQLFNSSVNKLYMLNVYTVDISTLVSNIINHKFRSDIKSVNTYSYLKSDRTDLKTILNRLIPIIRTNEINTLALSDLYELYSVFSYLKKLESTHD